MTHDNSNELKNIPSLLCQDGDDFLSVYHQVFKIYPNLIDLSTARLEHLLADYKNPHDHLPPVIHIAGTNGKGSTLAWIAAILHAHGKMTHRNISPYMVDPCERITLGHKPISEKAFKNLILDAAKKNGDRPISSFELIMAVSFIAFAHYHADYMLLETVMGGRDDVTNIIKQPEMAVISPISMDHMRHLGNDVIGIAKHKAGIIKPNRPVVIGKQSEDVLKILCDEAKQKKARTFIYGQDYHYQTDKTSWSYQGRQQYDVTVPADLALYLRENLALAMACIEQLADFEIEQDKLQKAVTNFHFLGRMQKLNQGPLCDLLQPQDDIYIDGAHNASGGEALANELKKWQADQPELKMHVILAHRNDKDILAFAQKWAHLCHHITMIDGNSDKAVFADPAQMMKEMAPHIETSMSTATDVATAIKNQPFTPQMQKRILVTGSLYLMAPILQTHQ